MDVTKIISRAEVHEAKQLVEKEKIKEDIKKIQKKRSEEKKCHVPQEFKTDDLWKVCHDKAIDSATDIEQTIIKASKSNLILLHNNLSASCKLFPGNLLLVGGYTNGGKTTLLTQLAADTVKAGKKVIYISNEERSGDIINMVAANKSGLNPILSTDTSRMTPTDIAMLKTSRASLDGYFAVLDHNTLGTNFTTVVEELLISYANLDEPPAVVIIDYITNLWTPGAGTKDRYEQLESFCQQLKNLINTLPFAVVVGAQLHSGSKRGDQADLDNRLLMGGSLLRVATQAIEVATFKDQMATAIVFHKARRTAAATYLFKFKKGRLELMNTKEEEDFKKYLKENKLKVKGV
jgi:KaiC/GvpD/RAD55 family RecA-like ATPase